MTQRPRDLSDESVRRALHDVADAVRPAPDLADRLLANARAGGPRVVPLASRRHTRWAAPLLAAAVVAVLAVGGVALSSTLADKRTPTVTQVPTVVPTPDPSASSASPTPSTSHPSAHPTSPPANRPTAGKAGAGRPDLTVAAVNNARIDLPSSGSDLDKCASGERSFHDGLVDLLGGAGAPRGTLSFVGASAEQDVDGDGADDVTAILFCDTNQATGFRVLTFRAKPGGGVEVLGDVTPPVPFEKALGRTGEPENVRPGARGAVIVRWSVLHLEHPPTQDRTYRWADGRFTQVGGSATFPDQSADLSVTTTPATLTKGADGADGVVTVVVRNAGPQKTSGTTVLKIDHHGLAVTRATGAGRTFEVYDSSDFEQMVTVPALAVGERVTVRLAVHVSWTPAKAHATVEIIGGDRVDDTLSNNKATMRFSVR